MSENEKIKKALVNFAKWLQSDDPKDNPLGLSPESTRGYILNEFFAKFSDFAELPDLFVTQEQTEENKSNATS
jgi:hypothetical protein